MSKISVASYVPLIITAFSIVSLSMLCAVAIGVLTTIRTIASMQLSGVDSIAIMCTFGLIMAWAMLIGLCALMVISARILARRER